MRRLLCALAVVVSATACSQDAGPAAAPTVPATPEVTQSPTPPPPPPVAPLTGEELDEPLERPVLAVKIDNAPAAVPPDGIEDADIVISEEVEGGLTRFLALFHSRDPGQVGPVRSGREADAELLPPFSPVLAYSGAEPSVQRLLRNAGVLFFEEGQANAFFRVDDRVPPHNLFAHTAPLWAAGQDLPALDEPVFAFDEEPPRGGEDAASVAMTFSPYASTSWSWKNGKEHWERSQNGSQHRTADGDVLTADNVVVMRIEQRAGARTDSAGNPTVELVVTGRGKATVLRDGKAFDARWRKRSAEHQLEFLDSDGEPFPLTPGTTWIELLNTDASLDIDPKAQ